MKLFREYLVSVRLIVLELVVRARANRTVRFINLNEMILLGASEGIYTGSFVCRQTAIHNRIVENEIELTDTSH